MKVHHVYICNTLRKNKESRLVLVRMPAAPTIPLCGKH